MERYALVNPDDEVDRLSFNIDPNVATRSGWSWLACPAVARPSFDPASEKITGPTYTINDGDVTEVWTKVSLSAQEISDAKDVAIGQLNGSTFSALAKVLLNHENRIRALENKGAITMAQFKAGVKALL